MAQQIFEQVQFSSPPKSAFDLTHCKKLSCNFGELIPAYIQEILPGDQFLVNSNLLVRLAPLLSPALTEIDAYMHYFFVPNRIIWTSWEDFITGGDPDVADPTMPLFTPSTSALDGTLMDYMGLPTKRAGSGGFANAMHVNNLPFRAYLQIYNDYYRDQNLIDELDVTDGNNFTVKKRAWAKDYFTSAFTEPQKGDAVTYDASVTYADPHILWDTGTSTPTSAGSVTVNANSAFQSSGSGEIGEIRNIESINVDIISLRRAAALQRFIEKDMIGGNRYIEHLKIHYGVNNGDLRLARPQYLGGGKQPVIISEVINHDTGKGELYGHGLSVGQVNSFKESFSEHGYVIGILSVMPRMAYAQGIPKHFTRTNRFDYYFPELANIGEQEIQNHEVWFDGDEVFNSSLKDSGTTTPYQTFGYQQRFAEYKYACDTVHGEFKDQSKLGSWAFKRDYDYFIGDPSLSQTFIEMDHEEVDQQLFSGTNTDHKVYVEIENVVRARRPMPYFADYRLS